MIRLGNMNETKINIRHEMILKLLERCSLSRAQIQNQLAIPKVTTFRDLKELIAKGLVKTTGVGKSTIYSKSGYNPLLLEPVIATRGQNSKFNFDVLNHLHDLLIPNEEHRITEIKKDLSVQISKLNTTIARKELERFVIELAWKSSRIEGNTYDLLETEQLIRFAQESAGHTKEEAIMILNHKSAFETIFHHKSDFQTLSMDLVTQLHNVLIRDMDVNPGIRKHRVGITGTGYVPLDNEWQIREALEKTLSAINASDHPIEKALIASAMIAYIQPFGDGNKRTSRMLTNGILMAHDYFPLSYRALSEKDYKTAIIDFYEQNSILPLKKILLGQYEYALNNYFVTND